MTEKTYKEQFADWFDEQVANGMKSFKPTFNYEAIAAKFGGEIHYDKFGMFSHLDFSTTPFLTIMHPEIQEYIYEGLYKFVTAPKTRLSNATDKWGDILDANHPDYLSQEGKIEHVALCRAMNTGVKSRYEIPLVLKGHIPPAKGKSIEDYQAEWDERIKKYEDGTGQKWPHPRSDS